MKYERFTKWEAQNCASVNGVSPIDKDMANAINYLAELEDKLENGTLIDMPRIIQPNKAEWCVQYQYPSGVIQYYICFSKSEAEEILKELKGE